MGEVTAAEIRAMIEQVYEMASWHTGDQVEVPPLATRNKRSGGSTSGGQAA